MTFEETWGELIAEAASQGSPHASKAIGMMLAGSRIDQVLSQQIEERPAGWTMITELLSDPQLPLDKRATGCLATGFMYQFNRQMEATTSFSPCSGYQFVDLQGDILKICDDAYEMSCRSRDQRHSQQQQKNFIDSAHKLSQGAALLFESRRHGRNSRRRKQLHRQAWDLLLTCQRPGR